MAAPITPPQDLEDLDKLTRMAIELRAARGKIRTRWTMVAEAWPSYITLMAGVMVWQFDPTHLLFLYFLMTFIVTWCWTRDADRRASERLERLEESLTLLSEEIAKRQRTTENQIEIIRSAGSQP